MFGILKIKPIEAVRSLQNACTTAVIRDDDRDGHVNTPKTYADDIQKTPLTSVLVRNDNVSNFRQLKRLIETYAAGAKQCGSRARWPSRQEEVSHSFGYYSLEWVH
jgi:hypothetical protein